jgi:hypothetical protein
VITKSLCTVADGGQLVLCDHLPGGARVRKVRASGHCEAGAGLMRRCATLFIAAAAALSAVALTGASRAAAGAPETPAGAHGRQHPAQACDGTRRCDGRFR